MCKLPEGVDLLTASFVCKPWARSNPKRFKSDPCVEPGQDAAVDTFHYTVQIIKRREPRVFILENVDGVGATRGKDSDGDTPLAWMLGSQRGLGSIKGERGLPAYTLKAVSSVSGTSVGVCQDRPRTLIFGVRVGEGVDVEAVCAGFERLVKAYKRAGDALKIQDFLTVAGSTEDLAVDTPEEEDLDEHIAYAREYKAALELMLPTHPTLSKKIAPQASRPSARLKATPRVKATVDVLSQVVNESGFPVADVSQRADRCHVRSDGTVPTLMTTSNVFAFKKQGFISCETLAKTMGYSHARFTHLPPTTKRKLVGNGFIVPICCCAVAAACMVTGHVKKA